MTHPTACGEEVVTRTEVVDALWALFDGNQLSRTQLIEGARETGARTPVLAFLERLPERPYWQPQQLWTELPDVPLT